jgi:hypothetical protein
VPVRRICLSRVRLSCLCAIAALAFAGLHTTVAGAATGAAAGNSFSELTQGGSEASTATTPTTSTTKESTASSATSNSNTSGVLLLGLIAAGALIAGIAFLILRDAHRVAPVPDGQVGAEGRPARDVAAMMRKRRARAKAARRQRKRNR